MTGTADTRANGLPSRRVGASVGAFVIVCYLLVAHTSFTRRWVPVRPLFDGVHPTIPYRWVKPPKELADGNLRPQAGQAEIAVQEGATVAASVQTDDGQLVMTLTQGAFEPPAGASAVRVTMTPADPATVAPPPAGLRYDSNAYRVEATAGGQPVELVREQSMYLRYARGGQKLFTLVEGRWQAVPASPFAQTLQLATDVDQLGTFVAAGPPDALRLNEPPLMLAWWVFVAIGLGVMGVARVIGGWWSKRRDIAGAGRGRESGPGEPKRTLPTTKMAKMARTERPRKKRRR